MRALVTGASGFCGAHLQECLVEMGALVHRAARGPRPAQPPFVHRVDDVTDPNAWAAALKVARPDVVFHLAGVAPSAPLSTLYRVHVLCAAALLEGLTIAGLESCRVLLVGSAAEYGGAQELPLREDGPTRPATPYGASKCAQTELGRMAARQGRHVTTVRPFNIIGPGMPPSLALGSFAAQLAAIAAGRQPPVLHVGNLSARRDYVDVRDAVALYVRLATSTAAGAVVNVCRGTAVSTNELLDRLVRLCGVRVEVRTDPARLTEVDVPVSYGSTELLTELAGPLCFLDMDTTLADTYGRARRAVAGP